MYTTLVLVAVLAAVFVLADLAYSRYVAYRLRRWEAQQQWDAEGVRTACREYTLGQGNAAVLLIHGFNDSPRVYDRMAPLLADAGFTVRVMRLPGFAVRASETSRVRREDWLASVREELQRLRAGHEQVFAVGHSLGGALLIATAAADASLVDGIGLLAPLVVVSRKRSPLLSPYQWHRLARRLLWFTKVALSPFNNDTINPDFQGYPWGTKFSVRAAHHQLFQVVEDNLPVAPQLTTPLLMVLARSDRIIDVVASEKFFHDTPAHPKQLIFVENSAHAIPLDNDYLQVTAALVEFFRALGPQGSAAGSRTVASGHASTAVPHAPSSAPGGRGGDGP